jgi:hypothetical protein
MVVSYAAAALADVQDETETLEGPRQQQQQRRRLSTSSSVANGRRRRIPTSPASRDRVQKGTRGDTSKMLSKASCC